MATTYTEFVKALGAIVIDGVTRRYLSGPPDAGNTADCPFQYVAPTVGGGDSPLVFQNAGSPWPDLRASLVVCVNPVAQSVSEDNYDTTLAMLDAMQAGLGGTKCTIAGWKKWTMRMASVTVAGIEYYAAIADIEAHG